MVNNLNLDYHSHKSTQRIAMKLLMIPMVPKGFARNALEPKCRHLPTPTSATPSSFDDKNYVKKEPLQLYETGV